MASEQTTTPNKYTVSKEGSGNNSMLLRISRNEPYPYHTPFVEETEAAKIAVMGTPAIEQYIQAVSLLSQEQAKLDAARKDHEQAQHRAKTTAADSATSAIKAAEQTLVTLQRVERVFDIVRARANGARAIAEAEVRKAERTLQDEMRVASGKRLRQAYAALEALDDLYCEWWAANLNVNTSPKMPSLDQLIPAGSGKFVPQAPPPEREREKPSDSFTWIPATV